MQRDPRLQTRGGDLHAGDSVVLRALRALFVKVIQLEKRGHDAAVALGIAFESVKAVAGIPDGAGRLGHNAEKLPLAVPVQAETVVFRRRDKALALRERLVKRSGDRQRLPSLCQLRRRDHHAAGKQRGRADSDSRQNGSGDHPE